MMGSGSSLRILSLEYSNCAEYVAAAWPLSTVARPRAFSLRLVWARPYRSVAHTMANNTGAARRILPVCLPSWCDTAASITETIRMLPPNAIDLCPFARTNPCLNAMNSSNAQNSTTSPIQRSLLLQTRTAIGNRMALTAARYIRGRVGEVLNCTARSYPPITWTPDRKYPVRPPRRWPAAIQPTSAVTTNTHDQTGYFRSG